MNSREDTRTFSDVGVDRIAQANIDEFVGADVANRGEAGFKRALRIHLGVMRLFSREAEHALVEALVVIVL